MDASFGSILRDFLAKNNLTQSDAHRKTGLSHTLFSKYCTDKRTPSPATLITIIDRLDIDSVTAESLYKALGWIPFSDARVAPDPLILRLSTLLHNAPTARGERQRLRDAIELVIAGAETSVQRPGHRPRIV